MDAGAVGVGSSVWVAYKGEGGATEYEEGIVTSRDGRWVTVKSGQGKDRYDIEEEENPKVFRSNEQVVQDMTALRFFHVPGILHNLRERAVVMDEPYTFLGGSVLVAVNPLRDIPAPEGILGTRDAISHAHPYAIAESAYQSLTFAVSRPSFGEKVNQSIIVGGESGAGKTESSKMVLHHLVERSSMTGANDYSDLDKRLLDISPILESFGNAATKRNSNSSRFGKFIKIHFAPLKGSPGAMTICAASVQTFLLERSRVVEHMLNERNFHVFYQLLEGASDEMRDEMMLDRSFSYLKATKTPGSGRRRAKSMAKLENLGEEDERKFNQLSDALDTLGVPKEEVYRILAGLLHLGNIKFDEKEGVTTDEAEVRNPETLDLASSLLSIAPEDLERLFLERKVRAAGELIIAKRDAESAKIAVDAVAKTIYVDLFEYLVRRITDALSANNSHQTRPFIGVLDIFGFESFRRNDLEQLLINYTNEALQGTFNAQIFEAEAALYRNEGLRVDDQIDASSVTLNQATMEFLGGVKGDRDQPGILRLIDIETQSPQPSDSKLCNAIHRTYEKSAASEAGAYVPVHPKDIKYCFTVHHYADNVTYTTGHFIEKNVDRVPDEVSQVLASSTSAILDEIFGELSSQTTAQKAAKAGRALAKVTTTITGRFHSSIDDLISTLDATRASFIRCIKPNSRMERKGSSADWFNTQYVIPQLRSLSIPQTAQILKGGFPTRIPFREFVFAYKGMMPEEALTAFHVLAHDDERLFVKALFEAFRIPPETYKIGYTRVFFKSGMLDELNRVLQVAATGELPEDVASRFRNCIVLSRWRSIFAGMMAYNVLNSILEANRKRESAVTILQRLAKRRAREARRRREEALRREEEARQRQEAARREAERLARLEETRRIAREAAERANRIAEAERLRQAEILAEEQRRQEEERAAEEARRLSELRTATLFAEQAVDDAEAEEEEETNKVVTELGGEDALADKLDDERQQRTAVSNAENEEEDDFEETMTVRTPVRARLRSRANSLASQKTIKQAILERVRQTSPDALGAFSEDEDAEVRPPRPVFEETPPTVFEDVPYMIMPLKTTHKRFSGLNRLRESVSRRASTFVARRMSMRRGSRGSRNSNKSDGDAWQRCSVIIHGYKLEFYESVNNADSPNPEGVNLLGEILVNPLYSEMSVVDGAVPTEKLMKISIAARRGQPGYIVFFQIAEEDNKESLLEAYQAALNNYKREVKLAQDYQNGTLEQDHVNQEAMDQARRWLGEGLISQEEFELLMTQQITDDDEIFQAEAGRYGEDNTDLTYTVKCKDCGETVVFIKGYDENPDHCPYCESELPETESDLQAETLAYRRFMDETLEHKEAMQSAGDNDSYPVAVKIKKGQTMIVYPPQMQSVYDHDELRNVDKFDFAIYLKNENPDAIRVVEEYDIAATWAELRGFSVNLSSSEGSGKLSSKDRKKLPEFPMDPKKESLIKDDPSERVKETLTKHRLLRIDEYMLALLVVSRHIKHFYDNNYVRSFFNLPVDVKTTKTIFRRIQVLSPSQVDAAQSQADELFAYVTSLELQAEEDDDSSANYAPEDLVPKELWSAIKSAQPALEATADPTNLSKAGHLKLTEDELAELSAHASQVLGVVIECEARYKKLTDHASEVAVKRMQAEDEAAAAQAEDGAAAA